MTTRWIHEDLAEVSRILPNVVAYLLFFGGAFEPRLQAVVVPVLSGTGIGLLVVYGLLAVDKFVQARTVDAWRSGFKALVLGASCSAAWMSPGGYYVLGLVLFYELIAVGVRAGGSALSAQLARGRAWADEMRS